MKRPLCIFLLVIMAIVPATGWAQESGHALFFSSNEDFKEGRFEAAARGYEALIAQNPVGGGVYFNLGNTYLKQDQVGLAILNYQKARVLMPRDPDLDFNLGIAKDKRLDQAEVSDEGLLGGIVRHFTGMEIFWIIAALNLFMCLFVTLRIWKSAEWNFYVIMALGLVWLTAIFLGFAKWYDAHEDHRAIVVEKQINIRAGPGDKDTLLFQLHDGSQVSLERREGDWSLIRFSPEKRGWTPNSGIAAVRPLRAQSGRDTEA